jgi:hypothetical protein
MASAAQVCKAILQKILVQDAEAPLTAAEYQDTIFARTNYMLDLDAKGVTLGYTEVTNIGDDVTIPAGALRGLIYNVAMEMCPEFGRPATAELVSIARSGLNAMRKLGVTMSETRYPSTLSIGSGNENYIYRNNHFFGFDEASILAETTGSISLETNTNEVADNG